MTRQKARAAVALLGTALMLAGCSPAGRPLARVGSHVLTTRDFLDAARGNELQYPAVPEDAKRGLLQDMIRRELLLEAARQHGLDTTRYARQYLATLRDRFALEALYARLAPQDPGVSEPEARRFYEWRATQAAAHVIYSPERAIVEAAAAALAAGADFARTADQYNLPGTLPPGGAIGLVSPGALVPPLDDALRTLRVGKVGGPYETPQGWFLLLVTRREPANRPPFETTQSQLLEVLRQRKVRQTMAVTLITLKNSYHAEVEKSAAPRMFQLLTPSRVGDAPRLEPSPAERLEVLGRWDGGTYTVGDALEDLKRPEVQKPAASLTPAIRQWIEGQVLTRLARIEAARRHLADEPDVARRIRGEYERFLLQSEYTASVDHVPAPDEAALRQVWDMMKDQNQQLSRADVLWIVIPDSATTWRVASHGGHGGGTLEDAVRMAGVDVPVHREAIAYPNTDPQWTLMRPTLTRMQPGEWAGPDRLPEGYRLLQVIDKVQGALAFESLSPEMRMNLEQNAWQLLREQRLNQYTDSLRIALQPNVYAENLRFVPWPAPTTLDVGR